MKTRVLSAAPVVFLVLLGFSLQVRADEAWQIASRDENPDTGFVLYAMRTHDTNTLRYRLETSFPANPRQAAQAIVDVMTSQEFAPERQQRQVLGHDETGMLVYTRIDLPMMLSDRDVALRVTKEFDETTGIGRVLWHSVHNDAAVPAPADGTLRMTRAEGYWEFVPDGAGGSHATYLSFTDIGGSLPRWLIEPMMRSQMTEDTQRVRAHLTERKTAVSAAPPVEKSTPN